ncbi:hypothetical protein [Paraburkholderia sp. JPY419]|uniref:hypothetical protein n=1 Tax=Paraburkholderia sp. JPY419 TaxID=667660 RepID=UPI003D22A48D
MPLPGDYHIGPAAPVDAAAHEPQSPVRRPFGAPTASQNAGVLDGLKAGGPSPRARSASLQPPPAHSPSGMPEGPPQMSPQDVQSYNNQMSQLFQMALNVSQNSRQLLQKAMDGESQLAASEAAGMERAAR